jgi:hypothetical protein
VAIKKLATKKKAATKPSAKPVTPTRVSRSGRAPARPEPAKAAAAPRRAAVPPGRSEPPRTDRNSEVRSSAAPRTLLDDESLPAREPVTQITLMQRDPGTLHAHWEISPQDFAATASRIGATAAQCQVALRLYAARSGWQDVPIAANAHNAYFEMPYEGAQPFATLGLRTPSGSFIPLARSHPVLPTAAESTPGVAETGGESTADSTANVVAAGALQTPSSAVNVTAEDIQRYYTALFASLRRRQRRRASTPPALAATSDQQTRPEAISSHVLGGASEQVPHAAHEFHFTLGTELIVYGRTEPSASVWLGNERITLRDDGSFSLRFALPAGVAALDFRAQSADATQQRRIRTRVEKVAEDHGE